MTEVPAPPARAALRFGERGVLVFAAVFLTAVPFGLLLLLLRGKAQWLRTIDLRTAQDLHNFDERHQGFVTAMRIITNSGSSLAWIVVLTLVGLWLLYRHLYRLTAFVAVCGLGSSLLNDTIKVVVGRTRPVLAHPIATATGKSFPSGHTQAALVGYGMLVLLLVPAAPKRWRSLFVSLAAVMVILIGFSRIALGVHYVSDVIGGLIIGTAWLLGMTAAFSAWCHEEQLPSTSPAAGLGPDSATRLRSDD